MATASPAAILAMPERAVADRPDPKGADPSDGQFAGLMAHLVQVPVTALATEPPPADPAPVSGEGPAEAHQAHGPAAPATPKASEDPAKAEPKPVTAPRDPSTAEAKPAVAEANRTEADAEPVVAQFNLAKGEVRPAVAPPSQAATPPQAVVWGAVPASADDAPPPVTSAPQAVALPTAISAPTSAPAGLPIAAAAVIRPSEPPAVLPETHLPAPPAPAAAVPPRGPSAPPQAQPEGLPATPRQAKSEPPPALRSAVPTPLPAQLEPAQVQAPVALQAVPSGPRAASLQAPPSPTAVAPVHPAALAAIPVVVQAALAEPGAPMKRGALAESQATPTESPKTGAPVPAARLVKAAETLPMPPVEPMRAAKVMDPILPPQPSLTKAGQAPRPVAQPQPVSEPGGAAPSPAAQPEVGFALAEALLPEGTEPAPVASLRASDGSPLAALTTLTRVADTSPAVAPTAPSAVAAPPTSPVLQIEGGLRWMLKGGAQEAQLQLHPESLGQVTIHLKVEGGEVHARLWITEPASVRTIQEGRPHLESALREQGLQLGNFDLQQGHRPHQEPPAPAAARERALPEGTPARQEAPAPLPPSILNPRHVELYA